MQVQYGLLVGAGGRAPGADGNPLLVENGADDAPTEPERGGDGRLRFPRLVAPGDLGRHG